MKNIILENYLKDIQEATAGASMASIYAFGIIPWSIWRTISSIYDKANRQCGTYEISNTRDACICRAQITRSKKRIEALNASKTKCNKKQKVDKCKNAIDKRIYYEKDQIEKNEKKLAKLKKQGRV